MAGYYGRPRFKLTYYSNGINAWAYKTFETRHEAVGEKAKLERRGRAEMTEIKYEESY